jgi:hypothetical protein
MSKIIYLNSDTGRRKTLGVPVVLGGDNLPSPIGIGLTDLTNIGGPTGLPGSGITDLKVNIFKKISFKLRM